MNKDRDYDLWLSNRGKASLDKRQFGLGLGSKWTFLFEDHGALRWGLSVRMARTFVKPRHHR